MAAYVNVAALIPPLPVSVEWGRKVSTWPMYGNDSMGDCTCAAVGHIIQEETSEESTEVRVPESAILRAYEAVSGYDPTTGANDNGATCEDVLKYWQQTGFAGHKLFAYMGCNVGDVAHVKASIDLFGAAYIGIALPMFAQNLTHRGNYWYLTPGWDTTADGQPGSWGGHCVPIVGYDDKWLRFISWGMEMFMSWKFFANYADESFATLSNDWAPLSGVNAPPGFNFTQLKADLVLVKN